MGERGRDQKPSRDPPRRSRGRYILNSRRCVLQDFTSDSSKLEAAIQENSKIPDLFIITPAENRYLAEKRVEMTLDAAREIRNHMAHVPGRKSVIWISGEAPPLWGADFAVYVVDARGLIGIPNLRAEQAQPRKIQPDGSFVYLPVPAYFPNFDAMKAVAQSTGGAAFFNSNDITGAVKRAVADGDVTYALGFYPKELDAASNSNHELRVDVKRRGLDLRYRKNYQTNPYNPPPERRISDAIASVIDSTQIGVRAKLERLPSTIRLPVSVEATDIAHGGADGRRTGALDFVFVQRAAAGAELDRLSRSVELSFSPGRYEEMLKQGFHVTVEMIPKPGLAEVKIIVLEPSSGLLGSLSMPVAQ